MCLTTDEPMITSKRQGPWLNIYINHVLHLSIYIPTLIKVQTWLDNPKWWQFWERRGTRFTIETTDKNGVKDISEYWNRLMWNDIASEINKNLESPTLAVPSKTY